MLESDRRSACEQMYEELGGDLCICQRADVTHWCESCQYRIDKVDAFATRMQQEALIGVAKKLDNGWTAHELAKWIHHELHGPVSGAPDAVPLSALESTGTFQVGAVVTRETTLCPKCAQPHWPFYGCIPWDEANKLGGEDVTREGRQEETKDKDLGSLGSTVPSNSSEGAPRRENKP